MYSDTKHVVIFAYHDKGFGERTPTKVFLSLPLTIREAQAIIYSSANDVGVAESYREYARDKNADHFHKLDSFLNHFIGKKRINVRAFVYDEQDVLDFWREGSRGFGVVPTPKNGETNDRGESPGNKQREMRVGNIMIAYNARGKREEK